MDPLIKGDCPASMRGLVGNRLPKITKEQSKLIKGSFDFIGLNYYTTNYAADLPPSNGLNINKTYSTDSNANLTGESGSLAMFNLVLYPSLTMLTPSIINYK